MAIDNSTIPTWQRLEQIDRAVMQIINGIDRSTYKVSYSAFLHDRYDCSDKGADPWSNGLHIPRAIRSLERIQEATGSTLIPKAIELLNEALSLDEEVSALFAKGKAA